MVVATAGGVKTFAGFADFFRQTLLDVHVNVFECRGKSKFALFDLRQYFFQTVDNLVPVLNGYDVTFGEHGCMCDTARDVLKVHTFVEGDGRLKIVHHFVGGRLESTAP